MAEAQNLSTILESIEKSEAIFSMIAQKSGETLWISDLDSRIRYISPSVLEIFGWTNKEYLSLGIEDKLPPESLLKIAEIRETIARGLRDGSIIPGNNDFRVEMYNFRKNGSKFWGETSLSVLFDAQGIPIGIKGITRNIDRLVELETTIAETENRMKAVCEDLERSEGKYREIVNLVPAGIFEIDVHGTLLFANDILFTMLGFSPHEGIPHGFSLFSAIVPDEREKAREKFRDLTQTGTMISSEYTIRRNDGKGFKANIIASLVTESGMPIGVRGVIIDNTEHVQKEKERERADRLEVIGTLAGGIAHDFNNILMAILGNLTLAKLESGITPDLEKCLTDAEASVFRARDLTRQLLTFSRSSIPLERDGDITNVVKHAAEQALKGIPLEFKADPPLPSVRHDPILLAQAVTNIVRNASRVTGNSGSVYLRLSATHTHEGNKYLLRAGKWLKLDAGSLGTSRDGGISSEMFSHGLKTTGSQSGLDLAIAHYIIRRHGGFIIPDETASGSHAISVFFPESDGSSCATSARKYPKKILFVDDDGELISSVLAFAADRDFTLDSARNGKDAARMFREAKQKNRSYDAVVLSLSLGNGDDAISLLRELERCDATVKAIITSGSAQDPIFKNYSIYGFKEALAKPFSLKEFGTIVQRVVP